LYKKLENLILSDPELENQWQNDLKALSDRIRSVRQGLYDRLCAKGTPGDWSHILRQIGMFSYTGLKAEHCKMLTEKWHVYLLNSGRISMSGINSKNIDYVANAIYDVVEAAFNGSLTNDHMKK
jgi:aspartate aminotransferase, cytoplasmic